MTAVGRLSINPNDPDGPLVARLLTERDPSAFAELYARYRDRVFGTAATLTGDRTLAEDITQEVFLRVYRKLNTFENRSILSTWIYRMTVNLATDLSRQVRRTRRVVDEVLELARAHPSDRLVDDGAAVSAALQSADLRREVAAAIAELSDKLSTVIVLRYLQGLSYEEIAEVLEISVGTVKSRLNRAHGELAARLRELHLGQQDE